MPIYEFEKRTPRIDPTAWVAPSAIVIGDVRIGAECYIGHGSILRGDYGTIEIGAGTAVEEGVIVHARPDGLTTFGERVTVGHGAMIHNATVERDAVVGMRSTIADWAVVGEGSIVGEGALIKNRQSVPAGKIAVGVPARVVGPVSDEQREKWAWAKELYIGLCERYRKSFREIPYSE